MNVGIIVYSHSGNTLSVAQTLENAIKCAGHTVTIARVEPENDDPQSRAPVRIKAAPDISPYDVIVFASPVHGFSLAPVMRVYLSQVSGLDGKKAYCFVTQQLKQAWLGGNRAMRQIAAACTAKGAAFMSSGVVNWSSGARDKQIDDVVGRFTAMMR